MKALLQTFFVVITVVCFLPGVSAQIYPTQEAPVPCLNKKFSIVAHVVRDSMGNLNMNVADIADQVNQVNQYFSRICASFEVCEVRIIDNFQYDVLENDGEWQEALIKYHQPYRINLFYVTGSLVATEVEECGFATPSGIQETQTGGIITVKDCTNAQVLAHQLGHYFGLLHTFENRNELVNGTNCDTAGDMICDTPADPYIPGTPMQLYLDRMVQCRFNGAQTDANGEFYRPDVGNLMSFYPDDCRCGFTRLQLVKMAQTYLDAVEKMW